MTATKRTLLVVEDDRFYNETYRMHCEEVLKELAHLDGTVKQAFSYAEAKVFVENHPVDFISVDIALSKEEEGKSDRQREEREAGGMTLLRELQRARKQPLAVIVSGETLLSYALDAYRKYGILAFYQKDRFNIDEYKSAVKAALWYLDALDLIEKPEIEAAAASWHKALTAARAAGIKEQQFPEPIEEKIEVRWTHPVTGLPIGRWTEERLRDRVVKQRGWALVRVTVNNFSKFVATYASQEESILSYLGDLLREAGTRMSDQDYFVGHLGHRAFPAEPSFVIIFGEHGLDHAATAAGWIKSQFESKDQLFQPALEKKNKPHDPIMSIETVVRYGSDEFFEDLHRLLDALGSDRATPNAPTPGPNH
jgi:ActR/RegA family two-component response regulator